MQFEDWAAQVVLDLEPIGLIHTQPKEEDWHTWARSAVYSSTLSQKNAPDPYQFKDWRNWAEQFILGVE